MFGIVVVNRADSATRSALMDLDGFDDRIRCNVDAQVDDLEPVAPEHHRDEVLADLVDVFLDRRDHDFAERGEPLSLNHG